MPLSPKTKFNLHKIITTHHVVIITDQRAPDGGMRLKEFLDKENILYVEKFFDSTTTHEVDEQQKQQDEEEEIDLTKLQINNDGSSLLFIGGKPIGSYNETVALHEANKLLPLIRGHNYNYDLIVIGGGSGGLAAAKEAASYGKSVALLDFVMPTPRGTKWGLGGTCVNVGCIPKKLMHHASLIGQEIEDAHFFGWQTKSGTPLKDNLQHDWNTLVHYVQNNIKGSNFTYKALLRSSKVDYINAFGTFVDSHTIQVTYKDSKIREFTANHFIIATGERPRYPSNPYNVTGALQYAITSDDLFSLPYNPGKTLIVGASYVALECAGFLKGLGNDVTIMVRSIVLRGFDRQCSELVRSYMEKIEQIRFIQRSVPISIVRVSDPDEPKPGRFEVAYRNVESGVKNCEQFNTIVFAIGRVPCTSQIGLENAGVIRDERSGYIPVNEREQTNVPNIYAVGDCVAGRPKLTPVAIEAGVRLAKRLYGRSQVLCDYRCIPTTLFTPLEYGCCGVTEEEAIIMHGVDGIEVYHQYFSPTEWRLNYYERPCKPMNMCFVKVITTRSMNNDPTEERLLGIHYVGPNAGEVIQFGAITFKLGTSKADLDAMIGVHPTCAELFTTLTVTKRSGKDATQKGCCG